MVEAVPSAYRGVTSYLIVRDAARAIEFYEKAFGARAGVAPRRARTARSRTPRCVIAGGIVMMSEEKVAMGHKSAQTLGGSPVSLMFYVARRRSRVRAGHRCGRAARARGAGPVLRRSQRHARRSVRHHVDDRHAHRGRSSEESQPAHGRDGRRRLIHRRTRQPYVLYGKLGSGAASVHAALEMLGAAVPARRDRIVGAERRVRRAARGQPDRPDPDARAARRQRDVRERRHPDPPRRHASGRPPAACRAGARAQAIARPRVHRGQLLSVHHDHRLPRALLRRRRRRRRREEAHRAPARARGCTGTGRSSPISSRRSRSCPATHRRRARPLRRRRVEMVGRAQARRAAPARLPRHAAAHRSASAGRAGVRAPLARDILTSDTSPPRSSCIVRVRLTCLRSSRPHVVTCRCARRRAVAPRDLARRRLRARARGAAHRLRARSTRAAGRRLAAGRAHRDAARAAKASASCGSRCPRSRGSRTKAAPSCGSPRRIGRMRPRSPRPASTSRA